MRLTVHTDYALRVLMYLALCGERLATIPEIARTFAISEAHLTKVVHNLAGHGYVETTRGRGGGLRLARPPEAITVGRVVRRLESDFRLVECFDPASNACTIAGPCGLQPALGEAIAAFLAVLDRYTIASLLTKDTVLRRRLALVAPRRVPPEAETVWVALDLPDLANARRPSRPRIRKTAKRR